MLSSRTHQTPFPRYSTIFSIWAERIVLNLDRLDGAAAAFGELEMNEAAERSGSSGFEVSSPLLNP
jgi:hypothetical protein